MAEPLHSVYLSNVYNKTEQHQSTADPQSKLGDWGASQPVGCYRLQYHTSEVNG